MSTDDPAKIYSDQRTVTIHLGDSGDGFTLPFKEKWRAPDAVAAVVGLIGTGAAVTATLDGGYALRILVIGIALTVTAVWLLSKLPSTRPSLTTRALWMWENIRPRPHTSYRSKP
jgi:hypothetical protein